MPFWRHRRDFWLIRHSVSPRISWETHIFMKSDCQLVHWQLDWELTVYLGQHFGKPSSVCPSISLYRPFARSSSSFTRCSKGQSSWPTVFWPSRGKPLVCGAGSWRYSLIWPSVTGSQTVGTSAALAELLFSDKVAKLEVVIAFTYKTNIQPHRVLSLKASCLCLAQNGTKPHNCCWDIAILATHPGHIVNPARKGERHGGTLDLNWCEKNTVLGEMLQAASAVALISI